MCVCIVHTYETMSGTLKMSNGMKHQNAVYKNTTSPHGILLNNLHLIVQHLCLDILGYLFAPSVTNYSKLIVSFRNVWPHWEAQLWGIYTMLNKIPVC